MKSPTIAVMIAVVFTFVSPLAFADGGSWSLDPTTSSARLFQGSETNPDSVNTGVARVAGTVKLDINDLKHSVFDLSIYPADEQWGDAVIREGILPVGYLSNAANDTLLTFKSQRILRTEAGQLKVVGELALTHVDRSVNADPSEAYAGPVYSHPVTHVTTREITFIFKDYYHAGVLQENGSRDLSGSAPVGYRDFTQLLSAVQGTNWPAVVQNEECQNPSTIGEDYHGTNCTGSVIAVTQTDNCEPAQAGGGEGYTGSECTAPSGNDTTIALDLRLLHEDSEASSAPSGTVTIR